jgi:hypothetical protein
MAPTRSSRHDCRCAGSTQKMRSSFLGHHIVATSELCEGVVKAPARRGERSESLDDADARLDADRVMADATEDESEISVESAVRSVRDLR